MVRVGPRLAQLGFGVPGSASALKFRLQGLGILPHPKPQTPKRAHLQRTGAFLWVS